MHSGEERGSAEARFRPLEGNGRRIAWRAADITVEEEAAAAVEFAERELGVSISL
jgi:hypothetical protein